MTLTFTIPGRLPSLNDLISAMNHNRYAGAGMKREAENRVAWAALAARLKPIHGRFLISVTWYEPNRRRDPDNVTSGVKFILDALQPTSKAHPRGIGIIPGDGQAHVASIEHTVSIDKRDPRVVVTLEEIA